jgi:hypothetical protein
MLGFKFRNSNIEIRNNFQNTKFECSKLLNFCHLIFGFVSYFGFRTSDLFAIRQLISHRQQTLYLRMTLAYILFPVSSYQKNYSGGRA